MLLLSSASTCSKAPDTYASQLALSNALLTHLQPNIKVLQIQLTGFLDKDTASFCKELWTLCLSAQSNPQGVPKELLEAKKLELIQEKVGVHKSPFMTANLTTPYSSKRKRLLKKHVAVANRIESATETLIAYASESVVNAVGVAVEGVAAEETSTVVALGTLGLLLQGGSAAPTITEGLLPGAKLTPMYRLAGEGEMKEGGHPPRSVLSRANRDPAQPHLHDAVTADHPADRLRVRPLLVAGGAVNHPVDHADLLPVVTLEIDPLLPLGSLAHVRLEDAAAEEALPSHRRRLAVHRLTPDRVARSVAGGHLPRNRGLEVVR